MNWQDMHFEIRKNGWTNMGRVRCQNKKRPYWKESTRYKNYGSCKKPDVFMVSTDEESYEVSGFNCACKYSSLQLREYELGGSNE